MNCREVNEFLYEYVSGILPASQRAEFERHLAACPVCVAYLDSYQKTVLLTKATWNDSSEVSLPTDAPEELVQAILRARSRRC